MDRGSTPFDKTAYLVVILVTFAASLAAIGVAAILDARSGAAPVVPRVELYDIGGHFVAASGPSVARNEIVCSRLASGGTICVEQLSPPPRTALWLRAIGFALATALLLGMAGGAWMRRRIAQRLVIVTGTIDRALQERDSAKRVPADLGTIATSVNALLAHVQEREVELKRRTTEVEAANKELESFVYAVSHDLRAPLGSIDGFAQSLADEWGGRLDESGRESIHWIRSACEQMRELIEGLLEMSRLSRANLQHDEVDLSSIARAVAEGLQQSDPARNVRFRIRDGVRVVGDSRLLRAVLENLMANSWKFTRGREEAVIEFGMAENAFYVRDNGAGFDPSHAAKMFRPFQRLHSSREFEGTGIGLATVQKIATRHGGKAWAEGEIGKGATVYFTTGS
jgi:signal transduction histidine kinase